MFIELAKYINSDLQLADNEREHAFLFFKGVRDEHLLHNLEYILILSQLSTLLRLLRLPLIPGIET